MKTTNFKKIVFVGLLSFILVIVGVVTMQSIRYSQTKKLCEQIKNGETIHTKVGNATTAPLFFDHIASVMQIDGPQIPLVEACYYKNVQAVRVLLENGADPDFFIEGRWSPLEAAVMNGPVDEKSLEIIQLLVEFGADVDAHASDISVAERVAQRVAFGNLSGEEEQLLKCLVSNGASIECRSGGTIFQYLVRGGAVDLANWLMEQREIDVNQKGYGGMTPLMLVVSLSSDAVKYPTVLWLLDHGADITLKDDLDKTAYDYAIEKDLAEIAELLK